jgi:hypothetical protein
MGLPPQALDDPKSPTGYLTCDNHSELKYLRDHHLSMARALVFSGLTPMELANLYGFTPGQITRIIGSQLFQAEIERLRSAQDDSLRNLSKDLEFLGRKSIEVVTRALYAPDEKLPLSKKLPAAFEVLDRLGHSKRPDGPQQHVHLHKHDARVVHEMQTKELLDDVMDLLDE